VQISLAEKRDRELAAYAKQTAEFMRENPDVRLDRNPKAKLPGDPMALRGLPAVGVAGAGGAINGTSPERETLRRLGRQR
jgi:hypothetical protein